MCIEKPKTLSNSLFLILALLWWLGMEATISQRCVYIILHIFSLMYQLLHDKGLLTNPAGKSSCRNAKCSNRRIIIERRAGEGNKVSWRKPCRMNMICQGEASKSIPGKRNRMSKGLKEDWSLLTCKVLRLGWGCKWWWLQRVHY